MGYNIANFPGIYDDSGISAARDGRALHKFANDHTPGSPIQVNTSASSTFHVIDSGSQVIITEMTVALQTASKSMYFEVGKIDNATGSGTFTPLCAHVEMINGAANFDGSVSNEIRFNPPMCVKYSDSKSVSIRTSGDADAQITYGWMGWQEAET